MLSENTSGFTVATVPTNGAFFEDLGNPNQYVETFLVVSWAEHLRQHERLTLADRKIEERVHRCVRGDPRVRHLIYVIETLQKRQKS